MKCSRRARAEVRGAASLGERTRASTHSERGSDSGRDARARGLVVAWFRYVSSRSARESRRGWWDSVAYVDSRAETSRAKNLSPGGMRAMSFVIFKGNIQTKLFVRHGRAYRRVASRRVANGNLRPRARDLVSAMLATSSPATPLRLVLDPSVGV